jgi:CBS domain-containing protein
MVDKVICFTPDNTVDECMAAMTQKRFRHIPIAEDGKVLGVVTIGDVVKHIISEQEHTINDLEKYITGGYV